VGRPSPFGGGDVSTDGRGVVEEQFGKVNLARSKRSAADGALTAGSGDFMVEEHCVQLAKARGVGPRIVGNAPSRGKSDGGEHASNDGASAAYNARNGASDVFA